MPQSVSEVPSRCFSAPPAPSLLASDDAQVLRTAAACGVQALLPAQVMVAGRRLEALLEQAIDAQLRRCMFHNNHRVAVSLLTDYVAGAEQIPTRTVQARRWGQERAHRANSWPGLA